MTKLTRRCYNESKGESDVLAQSFENERYYTPPERRLIVGMCKPSGGKEDKIGKIGDLEAFGTPNTRIDMFNEFRELIQQRWYGPDGRAIMNRDWKHSDNGNKKHKFPHDHPWDWTKNPPRQKYNEERKIDIDYC